MLAAFLQTLICYGLIDPGSDSLAVLWDVSRAQAMAISGEQVKLLAAGLHGGTAHRTLAGRGGYDAKQILPLTEYFPFRSTIGCFFYCTLKLWIA
jgi:hypothetical protein